MPLFRKTPIHEEINVHPNRGAVTDVTPQEIKESSRDRQFALLDVLTSLSTGQLASNADLLLAIDRLEEGLATTHANRYKLSPDGRQLVADVESLLRTARAFITEKNGDEALQKLGWHAALAAKGTATPGSGRGVPLPRFGGGQEYREGVAGAASAAGVLIKLVLTDPNFRAMLSDVTDIFASSYAPMMHDRVKQTILTGGMPSAGADDSAIHYESSYDDDRYSRRASAAGAGSSTFRRSRSVTGYGEPIVTRTLPADRKVYVDDSGLPLGGTGSRAHSLDRRSYHASAATLEREGFATHERRTTAGTFRSKAESIVRDRFPPEHRSKLARRVRALLYDLADNPQYQDAVDYLIDTVQLLSSTIASGSTSSASHARVDANVYATAIELKRVFESLAGASLAPVLEAWLEVGVAVRNDAHLRAWLIDVRSFTERSVRDPRTLDAPDFADRLGVLLDRGAVWSDTPVAQRALDESLQFLDALRRDRVTRALARDFAQVTHTLFYSPDGKLAFKGDLVNDMRVVFLPAVLQTIKFIALPRVEHRDADMDLVLENIVLTSANFMPNLFEIEMVNRAQVSPRAELADRFTHLISLNAFQIQADVRDVSFYYRKKTGFPKLKDWGVADLAITGEGIHVHVVFELDRTGSAQTLVPIRVRCNVDDIRLTLHHTKHDALYKLVAPIIKGAIRRAIIDNVESTLLGYLLAVDSYATRFKASRASERARLGITQRAPSFLRSFVPSFARRGVYSAGDDERERKEQARLRRRARRLGGGDARYRRRSSGFVESGEPFDGYGNGGGMSTVGRTSSIYTRDDTMGRRPASVFSMPQPTPLSTIERNGGGAGYDSATIGSRRSRRYAAADEGEYMNSQGPAPVAAETMSRRGSIVGM